MNPSPSTLGLSYNMIMQQAAISPAKESLFTRIVRLIAPKYGTQGAGARPSSPDTRNQTVDTLRGVAAMMVCLCHLVSSAPSKYSGKIEQLGGLGVQIFFVISGFIIPYILTLSGYQLRDFFRFWLKRLVRLQPPFVAAVLITGALSWAAAAYKNEVWGLSVIRLLRSCAYLEVPPENPVFWTLIVELKYYLLCAALFPLIFNRRKIVAGCTFALLAVLPATPLPTFGFLPHLCFFLLGFAACKYRLGHCSKLELGLMALVAVVPSLGQIKPEQLAAGLLTALTISAMPNLGNSVTRYFGHISYSLYLIHFPIGIKFLNLFLPKVNEGLAPVMILLAWALCIASAHILCLLIEAPAAYWSSHLKLNHRAKSKS